VEHIVVLDVAKEHRGALRDELVLEEPSLLPVLRRVDAIQREQPALDAWDGVPPDVAGDGLGPALPDVRCAEKLADLAQDVPVLDARHPVRREAAPVPYIPGAARSAA
jgi:hypothetical protein